MKVLSYLSDVLQDLNVIGPGDPLEDDDAQRALRVFQMMADTFAGDGLLLYTTTPTPLVLIAGQQAYTIGPGGDLDVVRPVFIPIITVMPAGETAEYPVTPYQSRKEWLAEPWKSQTDLYPSRWWYEPTYPLGTLNVWPVPTTGATLKVALPQQLTAPATLTTDLAFPPTYWECYHTNLIVRLAPAFQTQATDEQKQAARDAMGRTKRLNDPGPPPARFDPALTGRGGYDIHSNQYRG